MPYVEISTEKCYNSFIDLRRRRRSKGAIIMKKIVSDITQLSQAHRAAIADAAAKHGYSVSFCEDTARALAEAFVEAEAKIFDDVDADGE